MPYLNLKVAGSLSQDQKAQLAEAFTESLEKIANKPKSATYVVIEEVPRTNWAKNGELLES